jgi:hypothetical protein
LGFVAGLIPPTRLYLHAAVGVSRNLKRPWLKDLELIGDRELSLNNQDKVENYLKPMKNKGFSHSQEFC